MKLFFTLVMVASLFAGNVSFGGQGCCGVAVAPSDPAPAACGGVAKVVRVRATPVRSLIEAAPVRSTLCKILAASKAKSACSGDSVKACGG